MYVRVYVRMYVCMYVRTYVCMHACTHVCLYGWMYACMTAHPNILKIHKCYLYMPMTPHENTVKFRVKSHSFSFRQAPLTSHCNPTEFR